MGSYQQFKYKKHFIRKNVFMRKHMFLNITVVVALMLAISFCMACSGGQADNHEKIDYTVVENEDLPIELKKLIDNKGLYLYCCRIWNEGDVWIQHKSR